MCFHQSCSDEVEAANKKLRRAIREAEADGDVETKKAVISAEQRAWIEEKKRQQALRVRAASSLQLILKQHAWPLEQALSESPVIIPADPLDHWQLFLSLRLVSGSTPVLDVQDATSPLLGRENITLGLLVLWTCAVLLICPSIVAGSFVLLCLRLNIEDTSNRLFCSFWLGLGILLVALTAITAFVPLQKVAPTFLFIVFPIATLLFCRRCVAPRSWSKEHWKFCFLLLIVVLLFVLGAAGTRRVSNYDTGFYHYQLTRWYYEYGAVPGLALIHHRLGFTSSLFALVGIFDWGPLEARMVGLPNLSALIVCVVFSLTKTRAYLRKGGATDQLFWPLCLLLGVACFYLYSILTSLPDVLECLFVCAFVWYILVCEALADHKKLSATGAPLGLVILGAAAFSVKANGIVMLGLGIIGAVYWYRGSWKKIGVVLAVALLLALPVLTVNTITSGYPLYPTLKVAAPVSWAMAKDEVAAVQDHLRQFPFFGYSPPEKLTLKEKATRLFSTDNWWLSSFGLLNLTAVVVLLKKRRVTLSLMVALLLLGLGLIQCGQVPVTRFFIGMFTVVPVLAIISTENWWLTATLTACLCQRLIMPWQFLNRLDILRLAVYGTALLALLLSRRAQWKQSVTAVSVCLLFAFQFMRPLQVGAENAKNFVAHPVRFLLPEKLPELGADEFVWRQKGLVKVRVPLFDQQEQLGHGVAVRARRRACHRAGQSQNQVSESECGLTFWL
jgi:hypothetical protein